MTQKTRLRFPADGEEDRARLRFDEPGRAPSNRSRSSPTWTVSSIRQGTAGVEVRLASGWGGAGAARACVGRI